MVAWGSSMRGLEPDRGRLTRGQRGRGRGEPEPSYRGGQAVPYVIEHRATGWVVTGTTGPGGDLLMAFDGRRSGQRARR